MSAVDIDRVSEALQQVIDPCSVAAEFRPDSRTLGIVKRVGLSSTPDGRSLLTVELRITSPACTFQPYFEQQVRERPATIDKLDELRIKWNSEFDWSDDDMSQSLKQRLREKRKNPLADVIRDRQSAIPAEYSRVTSPVHDVAEGISD